MKKKSENLIGYQTLISLVLLGLTGYGFTETVTEPSGPPDLVATSAALQPDPDGRMEFRIGAVVCNQGTGNVRGKLRYYASIDSAITAADELLDEIGVGRLDPTSCAEPERSDRFEVPNAGVTEYYGVCVEPVAGEANCDNNCALAGRITVAADGTPIYDSGD